MDSAESIPTVVWAGFDKMAASPLLLLAAAVLAIPIIAFVTLYTLLFVVTPTPRPPRQSEKQYVTVNANGSVSAPKMLPCWFDNYEALKEMAAKKLIPIEEAYQITDPEIFISLVIPAYNEQERLSGMLEEAVEYLESNYSQNSSGSKSAAGDAQHGWEIVLVSDGSTDKTVEVALNFARTHMLNRNPPTVSGPWNSNPKPTNIPPGTIRVVTLEQNRGKGGAVTHGLRHVRGTYVVFADADGASKFSDLGKLVAGCEKAKDKFGRAVSVGSRAHMVGTEAVVKRSVLRNLLMRAFHLAIWLLTTPRVAKIKDTQCGFKLFTRPSLPYIVPFMHSEGWIFDVEMLMLAESANIPMVEVPVGWKEVMGSKLNVIKDSLGMAMSLALLRFAWGMGIYVRD